MVWRRNGSAIDKQENSITAKTVTSDINLTLRSKELFSNYSCEATNSVGKDAVVFTISLNGEFLTSKTKMLFSIYTKQTVALILNVT